MLPAIILLGLCGLLGGLVALVRTFDDLRNKRSTARSFAILATLGLFLAAGLTLAVYPFNAALRIYGFPFPAAFFERHGDRWSDYVGPLSAPAMLGNVVFAFCCPFLLSRIVATIKARRVAKP